MSEPEGAQWQLGRRHSPTMASGTLLLVPVGSCEQHGPHLPLDTDTRIAVAVANVLADRLHTEYKPALVAPAVAIGASGEHTGFAGTLSIGTDVLANVLIEIVRSAGPEFATIVFVNGHGGNGEAVHRATSTSTADGHDHVLAVHMTGFADAHAGVSETSLMLYLHPELVGPLRPVGAVEPFADLLPAMRQRGVRSVAENGVLGDARDASNDQGERLFDSIVTHCLAIVMAHAAAS